MVGKYVLAHDMGTGGNKAVLTDMRGTVLHSTFKSYELTYPRHLWVEQNPSVLWDSICLTTRTLLAETGVDPGEIAGVGVAAQMFNLLPVDERMRPLTPMISWLDLRSVSQADSLHTPEMRSFLFEQTGNIPMAKDIIPKILWLRDERPDVWTRTHKLLDCKEYMLFKLTGKCVTDWHGASVYFLFSPAKRTWSEMACQRLGIPIEMLPTARPCTDVIGAISDEAANRTGLMSGTPVVNCAGDVAVAQTGSGSNATGRSHLCMGTATWIGVSTSEFRNDAAKPAWGLSHIDPRKWIIAGEMETGCGSLMWFRDSFCQEEIVMAKNKGVSAFSLLSEMAESVAPGAENLLFAPWLSGERAPILDHYARGAFIGLSMGHGKRHMARSVMEGVAYHLRWVLESLVEIGLQVNRINTIGGGSTSKIWTQIVSDVTGRSLHVIEHPQEAGAMGAAFTVLLGLGVIRAVEQIDDMIAVDRVVEPNELNRGTYDRMYGEYRKLYSALSPIFRGLKDR